VTAAVLAPGPSLAGLGACPAGDLVLSINRAGLRFPSDWWAAADYPMVKWHGPAVLGTPNLLTRRDTAETLRERAARFPEVAFIEDVPMEHGCPPWQGKTLTCAMAFAFAWGAQAIDIFGADMEGYRDWDGVAAGEDRTLKRWEQERAEFGALADWMRQRGCAVTRK